jgi:hypothetical protein
MSHQSTFLVYIDESGDEGFVFKDPGTGSSSWLVVSAVIIRREQEPVLLNALRGFRDRLQLPKGHALHFAKMKNHDNRVGLIGVIASLPIRTVSIAIHKPSITNQASFSERDRLYCYACRYLLERVSWCCRDARSEPSELAELIFSNKSTLSYDKLKAYLDRLKEGQHSSPVQIDWSVISSDRLRARSHTELLGLQVADAVASGLWTGLERSRFGYVEDRFGRMLKAVTYTHNGKILSYGLKFWPASVEQLLAEHSELGWIATTYQ